MQFNMRGIAEKLLGLTSRHDLSFNGSLASMEKNVKNLFNLKIEMFAINSRLNSQGK